VGQHSISVGGFGEVGTDKSIVHNLSQAPAHVGVIVRYQDIHRIRFLGQEPGLKRLYPRQEAVETSENRDFFRIS
jgi:hypothetical protein